MNIAIDGYAGSGKSTIAHKLAEKLGIKVLDTGAIYRGLGCAYRDRFGSKIIDANVLELVKDMAVDVHFEGDVQKVVINEKDYTPYLREEEISNMASAISKNKELREKILHIQRKFAENNDCILEGRDIGTVILPNANIKLFVTADAEIRAKRRFDELVAKGAQVTFEEVLEDLKIRDYNDTHREIAPLCQAKDAILVDTSNMNLEEGVNYCLNIIKSKL